MKFKSFYAGMLGASALAFSAVAQVQPVVDTGPSSADEEQAAAPDPLSSAAAVYATYHGDVTQLKGRTFTSSDDIQSTLNNLGGQNSDQLSRGWMAYSALIASQDPEFRAAVRDVEGFYGKDNFVHGLQNDVRYARQLHGGTSAIRSALSAVESDSQRLVSTAAFVKEQAYTLQGQGWAKGRIGDSGALATRLRASSLNGRTVQQEMVSAFSAPGIANVLSTAGKSGAPSVWENVSVSSSSLRTPDVEGSLGLAQTSIASGKEPVADQIATLAAYRIIADEEGMVAAPMQRAMTEKQTAGCLKMAQLNLQQCIAASYQHFEVPFCIGEHALADVGRCIGEVSQ